MWTWGDFLWQSTWEEDYRVTIMMNSNQAPKIQIQNLAWDWSNSCWYATTLHFFSHVMIHNDEKLICFWDFICTCC